MKGRRRNRQGNAPADRGRAAPHAETREIQRLEARQEMFQGPIPHPELLGAYDALVPGAADRLIRMAEEEAEHRRRLESEALQSDIADRNEARAEARRGQGFGFLLGMAAILGGTATAIMGAPWPGGLLGAGGLAALVAVFVIGRRMPAPPES